MLFLAYGPERWVLLGLLAVLFRFVSPASGAGLALSLVSRKAFGGDTRWGDVVSSLNPVVDVFPDTDWLLGALWVHRAHLVRDLGKPT